MSTDARIKSDQRANVASGSCARIHCNNDTSTESERERGSTVLDLDPTVGVGVVIRVKA